MQSSVWRPRSRRLARLPRLPISVQTKPAEIPSPTTTTRVEAAIDQRRQFFEAKRDRLYQVEIFYCVVLEGARSKTGVGAALARLLRDPAGAMDELKTSLPEAA